jgi:uncharacterized membrane protein YbhN (UPF0104 family)
MARIHSSLPEARLVVIGEGPEQRRLEALARRLGVAAAIEFRGYRPRQDIVEELHRCHVLLQTSPKEGWGLTVIEANECAVPAVASRAPGLVDSVRDGETGLLARYGDAEDFAGLGRRGQRDRGALVARAGRASPMTRILARLSGRSWLWFALRIALSLGLLIWLFARLGGEMAQLRELRWHRLWPAALVFALSSCLGALQWGLLLRQGGLQVGAGRVFRLYWAGLFANNFLPTNFGGDLVKVADLAMHEGEVVRPFAATLLDRLLGLLALILLAAAAGIGLGDARPAGIPWWLLALSALPVLGAFLGLLSRRLNLWLASLLGRVRRGRRVAALGAELVRYRLQPGRLFLLLGLALWVQALRLWVHLLVAAELGVGDGLQLSLQLVIVVALLALAMVLPVTFNGLGLREWAATRLLPQLGLTASTGVTWQLATYLVQVAVSLIGGVNFAVELSRGRLLGRPQREREGGRQG